MPLRRVDGVRRRCRCRERCRLGHAARRHGEVPRRRRPERRDRGAQRALPPRRHARRAAVRRRRAARRCARESARRRLAHRDARDRRRGDRPGARRLRGARAASARPRAIASSTSGCPTRDAARARGAARRHRRAADDLHPRSRTQLPRTICRTRCCRAPIRSARCSTPASRWRCRRTRRSSKTTIRSSACWRRSPGATRRAADRAGAGDHRRTRRCTPTRWAARRDRRRGATAAAIEPGKWADLAVLSGDPLVTPADELSTITVEQTWLAGAVRLRTRMNTDLVPAAHRRRLGRRRERRHLGRDRIPPPRRSSRPCPSARPRTARARSTPPAPRFAGWAGRTAYERGAMLARPPPLMRARADDPGAHHGARERQAARAGARRVGGAADLFEWFAEEGKRAYGRTIPSRVADQADDGAQAADRRGRGDHRVEFPGLQHRAGRGAALAAGCTVVVRPSEYTPLTAMNAGAHARRGRGCRPASSTW